MVYRATYIECACIVRVERHDRLAAQFDLGAVLRPEPGDNLDTVRHDRSSCVILERPYVQEVEVDSDVVGWVRCEGMEVIQEVQ